MVARTWIKYLRRDELLAYGREFGISMAGTVEELRNQFSQWVKMQEGQMQWALRLSELARKHGQRGSTSNLEESGCSGLAVPQGNAVLTTSTPAQVDTRPAPWGTGSFRDNIAVEIPVPQNGFGGSTGLRDYPKVAKQVREWEFRFDGSTKPLEFLEQVEWSAETYGLDLDLIPRTMPELLTCMALKWYVANNNHWTTWAAFVEDFEGYFLPRGYFTKLREEVSRRRQKLGKPFKVYMVEMQQY